MEKARPLRRSGLQADLFGASRSAGGESRPRPEKPTAGDRTRGKKDDPQKAPAAKPARKRKPAREDARSMAARQRDISVSEFFTKNRHLLGFDNPQKALLTAVKEAVDNSLDACEEAGILPDLEVEIAEVSENRYRVAVQDNGPGIVQQQVPKIFGKLLYGSKFHRLKQQRGQQGIGRILHIHSRGQIARLHSHIQQTFYCHMLPDMRALIFMAGRQ